MRILFAILALGASCAPELVLVGCGASSPNALDVSAYGTEQFQCVEQADARPAADACRAASRAAFCAKWPTLQTCFPDGGGQ